MRWQRKHGPLFRLLEMDRDELMPYFRAHSDTARLIPPCASEEQAGHILDVFRANARAAVQYRPRPYPGTLVLILRQDP